MLSRLTFGEIVTFVKNEAEAEAEEEKRVKNLLDIQITAKIIDT
jgi:hypothetical protein